MTSDTGHCFVLPFGFPGSLGLASAAAASFIRVTSTGGQPFETISSCVGWGGDGMIQSYAIHTPSPTFIHDTPTYTYMYEYKSTATVLYTCSVSLSTQTNNDYTPSLVLSLATAFLILLLMVAIFFSGDGWRKMTNPDIFCWDWRKAGHMVNYKR